MVELEIINEQELSEQDFCLLGKSSYNKVISPHAMLMKANEKALLLLFLCNE